MGLLRKNIDQIVKLQWLDIVLLMANSVDDKKSINEEGLPWNTYMK